LSIEAWNIYNFSNNYAIPILLNKSKKSIHKLNDKKCRIKDTINKEFKKHIGSATTILIINCGKI